MPEPDALLTDTPMLAGLDGLKMSKTRGNGIALRATEDETAAMIRRAPTDSERHISYDPLARPAVAVKLSAVTASVEVVTAVDFRSPDFGRFSAARARPVLSP